MESQNVLPERDTGACLVGYSLHRRAKPRPTGQIDLTRWWLNNEIEALVPSSD